jgi:hypothetical protein
LWNKANIGLREINKSGGLEGHYGDFKLSETVGKLCDSCNLLVDGLDKDIKK